MGSEQHLGDEGYTGNLGEGRIPKNDPRLELLGSIDEVSSVLGMACSAGVTTTTREYLRQVQRDLYGMMSEVSASPQNAERFRVVNPERMAWIDQLLATLKNTVQAPDEFILPGDTFPGAVLDFARTVVRRAERRMADVFLSGGLDNQDLLRYLNRLSLVCFMLELYENQAGGKPDPTLAKPNPPSA